MKRILVAAGALAAAFLSPLALAAPEEDRAGCKDLPLFTRMSNFVIDRCEEREFDQYSFAIQGGKPHVAEGKRTIVHYHLKKDQPQTTTLLQIVRNFNNAARAIGCTVSTDDRNWGTYSCDRKGQEVWARVVAGGVDYELVMVEKADMKQEVKGIGTWAPVLEKEGRVALYVNFDTDKAELKSDAAPTIDEIVKVMQAHADWKIGVEGHTDNTGDAAHNKQLSEARAKSVVAAIAAKGVDAERLSAAGYGPEFPIADNRTEMGRAKNRRVELVKK